MKAGLGGSVEELYPHLMVVVEGAVMMLGVDMLQAASTVAAPVPVDCASGNCL